MPKPSIRPVVRRINAVCRACNLHPALHPSECQKADWCVTFGPHAQAAVARRKAKRVVGDQAVRRRWVYDEEGNRKEGRDE